ncbi:MAG: hypothetical protein ACJAVV_000318 [Alphaproteobacteria bacterium]|jgi:hypothetical protein
MNEEIISARDFIQTYGLYIQAIALCAYMVKVRKATAFMYCVVILLIFTIVQYFMEKQLLVMAQDPTLQELVRNLWYLGFAYTDAFLVLIVLVTCRKKPLIIDRVTRLILFSYVALGLTQVMRYVDRVIYDTDKLGTIYSIVIPSINISITALICGAAIAVYLKEKA